MTYQEMKDLHNAKVQNATASEAKDFSPPAPSGGGTGFQIHDIEAAKATARKFQDLHDRIVERNFAIRRTQAEATKGFCGDEASKSYADNAGTSLDNMFTTNHSMAQYAKSWVDAVHKAIDSHQQNDDATAQALKGQ